VPWNLLSVVQIKVDIFAIRFSTLYVSTHNKITLTVTLTQTTIFQLATKSENIRQQHITNTKIKSGVKTYIIIDSPYLITPQTKLLQVAQELPHKPSVKTNTKKSVVQTFKNFPKNLITTTTANTNFLHLSSQQNYNVSRMQNFILIDFKITLIMFCF
jgi:hypothetical protein